MSRSLTQRFKKLALLYDYKELRGVGKDLPHQTGTCTTRVQASESVFNPIWFVVLRQCFQNLILGLNFICDHLWSWHVIVLTDGEPSCSLFLFLDYSSSTNTPNVLGGFSLSCTMSIPPSMGMWLPVTYTTTRNRASLIDVATEAN